MATPEEIASITDDVAAGPARMKVGQEEAEQQSLRDLLALEKHRAANAQAASAGRLIFNKISPPGAV